MPIHYLTLNGFAERIGVARSTLKAYQFQGRLPQPDATLGEGRAVKYGWLPETIDAWQAARPGRGRKAK